MRQKRDAVSIILLSIITCGLYTFYWMYVTMVDMNEDLEITDMDPGLEILLCFFCLPYLIYWTYKYAGRLRDNQIKAQMPVTENTQLICVLLAVFGLYTVVAVIMQLELNKIWNQY